MSRQGVHQTTLPPPPPPSVSSNSSSQASTVHLNPNPNVQQLFAAQHQQQPINGSSQILSTVQQNTVLPIHGGGGQPQQQQQQQQQPSSSSQVPLQQQPTPQQQQQQQQQVLSQSLHNQQQLVNQQLIQEQYRENALQRIRDDLKPFNKGDNQPQHLQLLQQQRRPSSASSNASSSCSYSIGLSGGGGSYLYNGLISPASSVSSYGQIGGGGGSGSNKGSVPSVLPLGQGHQTSQVVFQQPSSSSSSQPLSVNNSFVSCDNASSALAAINNDPSNTSSQFYRQIIEKSLPEEMLALLQEKGLVNLLENILKHIPPQQQQQQQQQQTAPVPQQQNGHLAPGTTSSTSSQQPQTLPQISHQQHQIVIDRANHHLGAASSISLNSVGPPPPPPSLNKLLRTKPPSPSTSQLESLESSSIYSAASERSVASCISSSCSVRSESPGSNHLHSQQSQQQSHHHLNGGHLLPDQPRIVSSNGVIIPNHGTSVHQQSNGLYHSQSSVNLHPKVSQTDSSGISCSEYSSGSIIDPQNDYPPVVNGSYPISPTPYHRLPQQQQQAHQQFNESAKPAAIAAKQVLNSKHNKNVLLNSQSTATLASTVPQMHHHQQLCKSQSATNFRPTDPLPLPPPPLPHRSTALSTTSSGGFHVPQPPPPVPPHSSKNYSVTCAPSIMNRIQNMNTTILSQKATTSFAYSTPSLNGSQNVQLNTAQQQQQQPPSSTTFVSQITQKLQNLSIQAQSFPQAATSSPPPSYAASSSSGRQSPTPTISSSSDYASIPMVQPASGRKRTDILESKLKTSVIAHSLVGPSMASAIIGAPEVDSEAAPEQNGAFQGWPAKHAQTQSPVIMQSVKSQKVQKPILQTAIAPSMPSIATPLTNGSPVQQQPQTSQPRRQHAPTGFASQPTVPIHSSTSLLSPIANTSASNGNTITNGLTPPPSYKAQKSNPPPYPSYPKQENNSNNYHSNPPPPYSSSVRNNSTNGQSSSRHRSQAQTQQQPQGTTPTGGSSSQAPPPPLPPPYSISLGQQQQTQNTPQTDSLAPLFRSVGSTGTPSIYSLGSNSSSSTAPANVQVPTTDPPSYASSMAALAAQRAQASTGPSTTTSGSCQTISSTPNNGLPPSMINRQLPPPPTCADALSQPDSDCLSNSSNCDLVNTVESICNSQISALHEMPASHRSGYVPESDANVPPLPPKPSSTRGDAVPPPPPPLPPSLHHQLVGDASSTNSNFGEFDHSNEALEDSDILNSQCEDIEDPATGKRTHTSPIPARKSISRAKEKERREFKIKNYSPAAFKFYMEQHMENLIKNQKEREIRRNKLEIEIIKQAVPAKDQPGLRQLLYKKESNYIRLRRAKMDITMFQQIKTIGAGAFGEVSLVRKRGTKILYAMKTLRKSDVLKRKQVAHVKAERDILAEADNEWVVKLYYSFQDERNLYFVMDYIPGGDLMVLLSKFGIFDENFARFYISELVVAVESVHKMGFIHRDIKPDNVLIGLDGHIKLTDFGLCTGFRWTHNSKYYHDRANSMDFDAAASGRNTVTCNCGQQAPQPGLNNAKPLERRKQRCEHHRCVAVSLVGTPNYIAPEVLLGQGYTQGCDWWSVGVILYEMVVGRPPFYANTARDTQDRVINWSTTLNIPPQALLTPECEDLILKLCCGAEQRLGRNGADEIKRHAFFASVDFESGLRMQEAPYKPTIRHPTDISNFDTVELTRLDDEGEQFGGDYDLQQSLAAMKAAKHPQHAFFEFTFRRFFDASGQEIPYHFSGVNETESDPGQDDDISEVPPSVTRDSANTAPIYACGTDSTMSETTSSQVSVGDLYDEVYNEHPNPTSASNSSANSSATATNNSQHSQRTNTSLNGTSETNGTGGTAVHNGISSAGGNATDSDASKGTDQDPSNNPVFV